MTNSLRKHFEKKRAERLAREANADLRYSAQVAGTRNRAMGHTMVRQSEPTTMASQATEPDADSSLELKFFNDWEQLSNIQSHEQKNKLKAEFLPAYLPWIEGTLSAGVGEQNDMMLKLMVWCLDTHDLKTATDIAEFALLNGMAMPEPFTRDVATIYAEQMAEELIKNISDAAGYGDLAERAINITTDHDMPDPVRAKLYRAYGNTLKDTKPDDAITAYERAISLDAGVGCKQDLNQLKK